MNRLLLDTNVLLDLAVPSRPKSEEAVALLGRIDEGFDEGLVSVGSLKDFYYIMQKHSSESTARGFVRLFMALLTVLALDSGVCACALESDEPDFEEGIVRFLAENEKADFIITRDEKAFARSRIKSLSPSDYLEMMGQPQGSYAIVDL